MTVPAVIQVSPVSEAATYSTARTVTFGSSTTPGSCLVLVGWTGNSGAASLAAATASVSMTDVVWQRRLDQPIRYENNRGLTIWVAENVAGGQTTISVTPALANSLNYGGFVALELSAAPAAFEAAVGANAENGANAVTVGPAPASGSISQADTMAVLVSFINRANNGSDPGWITPSGWTERAKTLSSNDGIRPLWVGTKTQTTTGAVAATISSSEADLSGRAAALLLIRGSVSGPPPPPPPAPGSFKFRFTGADAAYAAQGIDDVTIQIHAAPTTEALLGTFIQSATNQEFVADGVKSAIIVMHNGTVPVTLGQSVRAVAQNTGNTAGFRGVITGTVEAA